MRSRCQATKPSVALWTLVAIGDLALLVASFGVLVLIALAGVVTAAVGAVAGWLMLRRGSSGSALVPARVAVPGSDPRTRLSNHRLR